MSELDQTIEELEAEVLQNLKRLPTMLPQKVPSLLKR